MSIKSQNRVYSQQRLTVPTFRRIDSSVAFDFDTVLRDMFIGTDTPYVIAGLKINIGSSTFSADAGNLTLNSLNSTVLHNLASEAGTILNIPGSASELLNATNSKVLGSFSSGSTNYVGLDFVRVVDSASSETLSFWDADAEAEFTKVLPTSTILDYRIVINQTGFGSLLPIATVVTNSANIPTAITDCRNLLWRLGTGGTTPNPNYNYPWSSGRTEVPSTTSSSSTDPFSGGDKQISTFRDWLEAVETTLKEIKGTAYWFEVGSGGAGGLSLFSIAEDANFSYLSGEGVMTHSASVTGNLSWSGDLYLRNVFSNAYYKIQTNPSGSVIPDGGVLAVNLTRYYELAANVTIAPTLASVPAAVQAAASSITTRILSGNAGDFTGLTPNAATDNGDFIKVVSDSPKYYSQINNFYDSAGSVTASANALYAVLSSAYAGSTGSQRLQYNKTYYTTSNLIVTAKTNVLDVSNLGGLRWIASRNDLSTRAVIYLKDWGELQQGESRQIDDNTSENILQFIGAVTSGNTNESLTIPQYSVTVSGAISSPVQYNYGGTFSNNLTDRVSLLTSAMADKAQDKNIALMGGGTVQNAGGLITFSATATIMVNGPGSGTLNTIAPGSINLTVNNSCAYVTIDRNANSVLPIGITATASVPLSENVFVIARKLAANNDVWVGIDGLAYLIADGADSSSGFNPASYSSLGVPNLHKWKQGALSGSIGAGTGMTLPDPPYSTTSLMIFVNGLFQSMGAGSSYDVSLPVNQVVTFSTMRDPADESAVIFARGNSVPFSYVQSFTTISVTGTNIAFTPSLACSYTRGVAVFLNGLQRVVNTDFTSSSSGVGFGFNLEPGDIVSCWYTSVNDNEIAEQATFNESATSGRTIYTYNVDRLHPNSTLVSFDGVNQFPFLNTYGLTSSNITVNDYRNLDDKTFEVNSSSLTTGTVMYVWSR